MRKYLNLPKFLKKEDYEECCRLVVDDATTNPTVRAVYLMGGEWCPGISDLDIVVVYKDNITPISMKSPWSLSEKAKFIFTHRYLSFNEKDAGDFYYLYPEETTNLRPLYG